MAAPPDKAKQLRPLLSLNPAQKYSSSPVCHISRAVLAHHFPVVSHFRHLRPKPGWSPDAVSSDCGLLTALASRQLSFPSFCAEL